MKLEITRFDEPLIVYGFIPGVFSGYVPLIVPIRETQSEEEQENGFQKDLF